MLRLIVNKAKHHYNLALEHAERGRTVEAIDELRNALDLDRRFTNAHVVLGTLYARNNEFDKAREAWNAALLVNPELSKAHNYLERVQIVQTSLPALKRLRIICLLLVAAVVFLVAGFFYSKRPNPAEDRLRSAERYLRASNYSAALADLDFVQNTATSGSILAVASTTLRNALITEQHQKLSEISEMRFKEQYPVALAAIADLEARHPDIETSAGLAVIREEINHYYREHIKELTDAYKGNDVSYEQLTEQLEDFLKQYPNLPEKSSLMAALGEARETEVERQIKALREKFDENHDFHAALDRLHELASQFPGSAKYAEGRGQLVEEMLNWMFESFQGLVEKRDFPAAHKLLSEINGLASEFRDVVEVDGPATLAGRVLSDAEMGERLREAGRLVKTGSVADARTALHELWTEDDLTTPERELVESYQADLVRRVASDDLKKLRSRADKIRALQMTDQEATQTLATALSAADDLQVPAERLEALSYATAAAIRANQRDRATKLLAQMKQEGADAKTLDALQKLMKKPKP